MWETGCGRKPGVGGGERGTPATEAESTTILHVEGNLMC